MTEPGNSIAGADPRDFLAGIGHVKRLARWAKLFIWAITAVLCFFFAWIQVKNVPFSEIVGNTPPKSILTTAIIIYYACWVGGANFDTNIQQNIYVTDPERGRLRWQTFGIVIVFCLLAVGLVWASANVQVFAPVLGAFILANIIGWHHICSRVKPVLEASTDTFEQEENFCRLEQIKSVQEYMTGRWQWVRFFAMLFMVLIINVISLSETAQLWSSQAISWAGLKVSISTIEGLLPGFSILLFVLIAEWPAPGSEDTTFGVTMGPEVGHGETEIYTRVQA